MHQRILRRLEHLNTTVRTDLLVVIGMVLAFIPTVLALKVRFLISTVLFFAVPAIYLLFRKPKQIKRLVAATGMGMVIAFIIDFLAEFNHVWSWAPEGQLVFAQRILGVVPIDVVIWYFFWILLIVAYYEHFFEHERSQKVSSLFVYGAWFSLGLLAMLVLLFFFNSDLLRFRYAYFWIGLVASVPFFRFVFCKPRLIGKLLKAGVFSVFLFLSFELTALALDQWRFPGEYIGTVTIFGLTFPFEEFVFWILLGTPIVLSYYELFVDDEQ